MEHTKSILLLHDTDILSTLVLLCCCCCNYTVSACGRCYYLLLLSTSCWVHCSRCFWRHLILTYCRCAEVVNITTLFHRAITLLLLLFLLHCPFVLLLILLLLLLSRMTRSLLSWSISTVCRLWCQSYSKTAFPQAIMLRYHCDPSC